MNAEGASRELPQGQARFAYRLDVNDYLGTRRLQLVVEHFEPCVLPLRPVSIQ